MTKAERWVIDAARNWAHTSVGLETPFGRALRLKQAVEQLEAERGLEPVEPVEKIEPPKIAGRLVEVPPGTRDFLELFTEFGRWAERITAAVNHLLEEEAKRN